MADPKRARSSLDSEKGRHTPPSRNDWKWLGPKVRKALGLSESPPFYDSPSFERDDWEAEMPAEGGATFFTSARNSKFRKRRSNPEG